MEKGQTTREREVSAKLESLFPGWFSLDPDFSRLTTYSTETFGAHACEYKIYVQVLLDGKLDVFATAPFRFTKESVGTTALARLNEYLDEASLTGLCSICLDAKGRLCVQHHLFEDINLILKAVYLVIEFLDSNVYSLMVTVVDVGSNPRQLSYEANRKFVAQQGNSIRSTLKACFSRRRVDADYETEQDVEEDSHER